MCVGERDGALGCRHEGQHAYFLRLRGRGREQESSREQDRLSEREAVCVRAR